MFFTPFVLYSVTLFTETQNTRPNNIMRFPVERDTTQVSTQSFGVKTLTSQMATTMYPMET